MNAESAAFVPSATGRKLSTSMADNTHVGQDTWTTAQQADAQQASAAPGTRVPRSTSAHNSPLVDTASGKFPGHPSGTSSSHARSSSLPGNGGAPHVGRGRGGSSSRQSTRNAALPAHALLTDKRASIAFNVPGGRGSSRGRGGARGGHSSTSDRSATQSSKKPSDAPSRPPVALDSVDEFPALGGGAPAPIPSKPSSADTTPANADDASSSPTVAKSSPGLSPSQSMKGLSFARVVAPAPPPSAPSSAPASQPSNAGATPASSSQSNSTAPQTQDRKTRHISASSTSASSHSPPTSNPSSVSEHTRATSPSTSMSPVLEEQAEAGTNKGASQANATKKKKKRSSKDQQSQGQGQNAGFNPAGPHADNAFDMYNGLYAEGGAYERDPFNVVIPDDAQRPYFEGSNDPTQAAAQPSPQPGLTPVQIAFLAANGFNVEGMPNVSNDAAGGMSIEALQEFYNPPVVPSGSENVPAASSSMSNLHKSTSGKKESKKSKKERNQAGHPQTGFPHHTLNGQTGPYENFDGQQQYPYFDPQYYDEQQQQYAEFNPQPPFDSLAYQQSSQEDQTEEQPNHPSLVKANGSFHFHPDVPSFQPRHFDPDAQEFKPKSPLLHADAPAFVPPTHRDADGEQQPQQQDEVRLRDQKAPNGFVSAVGESEEETPKPIAEELPEEREPQASSPMETQTEQTESQTTEGEASAAASVPQQIQDRISEAVEAVKETVSNITSTESAEEEKGNTATDESAEDVVGEKTEDASLAAASNSTGEGEESVQEEAQSPPHSTFSLLPPVTVEDVLDKAQSMAESVKETAQDAVASVGETIQSVSETVTETIAPTEDNTEESAASDEQDTKDNLDELDIPNDGDEELEALSTIVETSTREGASANLDELDLPDEQAIESLENSRHSKESSSTSASESLALEQSQLSISPSEVELQLATATEAESGMPALQDEIEAVARASFAPSSVGQFEIISQSEDQCPVISESAGQEQPTPEQATLEIISTSEHVCDVAVEGNGNGTAGVNPSAALQIISQSEDQCLTGDETRGVRSATLDSLASTESSTAPFVRSTAPSPSSRQEELSPAAIIVAKPDVPAITIPLQTPPVVISPSTPISPESGSPIRPSQLSSPEPLSKTLQSKRPEPIRQPSEAEKDAAIRLVRELRSEPSTPVLESEDMMGRAISSTVNASTPGESTESETFRFDLSGRFSELNSSKRKRGKADDEEDEDPDKKERKVEDSGEAPSLTMSIFSGSILPRKQFIVSILASLGINLFLPFVNGVMLGFGEIFARDWLGPLFGFGRNRSSSNASNQSFSQSSLGIRGAGNKRGGAQDVPGDAAAKIAVETVTEEIVQAPSKL